MNNAKEGVLTHREDSPTAASATRKLFRGSGVMPYAVTVVGGMGQVRHEVDAATGDEAAELALKHFPGAKVAHVEPAARKAA